jgi:hypothetical protein
MLEGFSFYIQLNFFRFYFPDPLAEFTQIDPTQTFPSPLDITNDFEDILNSNMAEYPSFEEIRNITEEHQRETGFEW